MKNQVLILRIGMAILFSIVGFLHGFSLPSISNEEFNTAPPTIVNTTICSNQLPYTWNGITCLAAGPYTVTLTASNGADSIVNLNLTVINVGTSITSAQVCDNDLPYHWNGNTYSANGTYSVTLTSANGCDSVPILSLTVNHVVTSTTNVSVCSNELPYTWNGNNYSLPGPYSVTLTSSAGCDSIATLNLSVKSVGTSTTNLSTCINNLPFHWNGNTYPGAGTYAVNLTGSNGCDSIATLELTVSNTATSTTNVTVCNGDLPYTWNGNSYPSAGTYSVNLTGTTGCDSVATLVITVPPIPFSTRLITVCTAQLPFTWNGNSYTGPGLYVVTLPGANGCDSIARLRLLVVDQFTSTTAESICSADLPYTWNGNNYNATGTYTASFVTAAGCDSVATLNLTVLNPHTATDTVQICAEQLPFTWHNLTFNAGGVYEINPPVAVSACHSVDTLNLIVLIIVPSMTTVNVCSNQLPYIWNGNSYNASGSYGVQLTSVFGCDSSALLNLTVNDISTDTIHTRICSDLAPYNWNGNNFDSTGIYPVNLVSANGCDSTAVLDLVIDPVHRDTLRATACVAQLPYNWHGNNYNGSGWFTWTGTASTGCDSIEVLNLQVLTFLSSVMNITICSSQLPYNWNGQNIMDDGTYSDTLVNAAGCDSIAVLNLTVNDIITSTNDLTICNTQLPYDWNGVICNGPGFYTATLLSSNGCDSIANLNLSTRTVASTIDSITICTNQLPYSWNGNSYPTAGTFPITLTNPEGCDSIVTLQLMVTDILTSTTNVILCNGQLPYSWNGNTYLLPGTYSVTLTNSAGCDSVPILSLSVVLYTTSTTNLSICSTQLPYSWNGSNYDSAGTYQVMLHGDSGCDSLATLNLEVSEIDSSMTDITICQTQAPYSWNGNSYSASGIYQVTLTNTAGCDSITRLNLLVNPVDTSTSVISICTNQLPYAWNGNNYAAAGTYSITLTGSSGCDSIAILNLSATDIVHTTIPVTICEDQLPYTWNGQTLTGAGNYPDTLTGSSGCDSIATLHLIVNPVLNSNTTLTICDDQLPYQWNGQSFNMAGTFPVTLTSAAGCDSIATLELLVNPVLTGKDTAHTCSNQLPFIWHGQSYTTAGNHTVNLTTVAGCDSITTLHLIIHPVQNSETNAAVCTADLPYTWNGHNYLTAGDHIVTLSTVAGCDSIVTLHLTVNPTPAAPSVLTPVTYCQYEAASALQANGASPLLWYSASSGGTGSAIAPVPSTTIPGISQFYVAENTGLCEGPRVEITVKVNPKPQLGPDVDARSCFGGHLNLDTIYNTTGLNISWTSNQQPVVNTRFVTTAGIYELIVTSDAGCIDTSLVHFAIQPELIANAGPDANIEYNYPYQLQGSGGVTYQWFPGYPLLNNAQVHNPIAILTEDREFILEVRDEIGCRDIDSVKLRVLNGPTFYIPTAFTPNGDGLNDIFRPIPVGIEKLEYFMVFNRFGELVYQTSEIAAGWDGTYKGLKQPLGGYVWKLKGIDRKGKEKFMKGNVVLVR